MKSGSYRTNFKGEVSEYRSFLPSPLQNLSFDHLDSYTTELLVKANTLIGMLNTSSEQIKDINQFIGAYVRKESLFSSQIEGTQATLENIFDVSKDNNINLDVEEVINYVKGINYSLELLDKLPICNRYIKLVHEVLMNHVRDEDKKPGEFRVSQNWIGNSKSTIKNAKYVPPNVDDMLEAMNALEEYINDDYPLDDLIKVALIHYQFETIHPFLDGNGRIGRMLIISYLIMKGKLKYPVLYLSYYLKRNQFEYYDRMNRVRTHDDYIGWINFFLQGIIEVASESIDCINSLVMLRNKNKTIIKPRDLWLLEYLESYPLIDARSTSNKLGLDYYMVNRTINKFVKLGVLIVTETAKKNRTYVYQEYLDILKK